MNNRAGREQKKDRRRDVPQVQRHRYKAEPILGFLNNTRSEFPPNRTNYGAASLPPRAPDNNGHYTRIHGFGQAGCLLRHIDFNRCKALHQIALTRLFDYSYSKLEVCSPHTREMPARVFVSIEKRFVLRMMNRKHLR